MSTLSVPLTPHLEEFIQAQVQGGHAANKADVVRRALIAFQRDHAVQEVLAAEQEPTLRGDLNVLMQKLG
jgi:putative addiction module CopG family antidote